MSNEPVTPREMIAICRALIVGKVWRGHEIDRRRIVLQAIIDRIEGEETGDSQKARQRPT